MCQDVYLHRCMEQKPRNIQRAKLSAGLERQRQAVNLSLQGEANVFMRMAVRARCVPEKLWTKLVMFQNAWCLSETRLSQAESQGKTQSVVMLAETQAESK